MEHEMEAQRQTGEEIDRLNEESLTIEPDNEEELENILGDDIVIDDELDKQEKAQTQHLLYRLGIVAEDIQGKFLTQSTPKRYIYTRQGKAGQRWNYVRGEYVKKVLNSVFAFQWDFEIVPVMEGQMFYMTNRQVIVMGKLTVRDKDGTARIVKMGVGKKDVVLKKDSSTPLDIGNDIKAAETDALKRCATGLGIGLDLYQEEHETDEGGE